MSFRWDPREHAALAAYVAKWIVVAVPVAVVIGSACALFLWLLDLVTALRWAHSWLLYFLPFAGIFIGLLYRWWGRSVEAGNNLIMEEIHEPGGGVPRRMAPLVLIGTLITHLFGGSAGREGTAVQMGGSIASVFSRLPFFTPCDRRTLLMVGVAAGFGGVFGTPLAGAVFALEVIAIGNIRYESIIPCLIASVLSDWACTAWGIHHTQYHMAGSIAEGVIQQVGYLNWLLFLKVALAAVAFGLVSVLFAELTHSLKYAFKRIVPWELLRPAAGGAIIIGMVYLLGTRDYLGLGVSSPDPHAVTILSSFTPGGAEYGSWFWKLVFTAVTLSSGFKGGEVTPLFFIGASLGNVLASLLGAPPQLFAALGFVAVFSGATNTPLACTLMGVELFGPDYVVYIALACFLAYFFSGHSGVYLSQRVAVPKTLSTEMLPEMSLRDIRELKPRIGDSWFSNQDQNVIESGKLADEEGDQNMTNQHQVVSKEIGQVRIYMEQSESRPSRGIKKLFSKPLYKEIIEAAKEDGMLHAVAHPTHYGFSGQKKVQSNDMELPNPKLNICIELIGTRDQLEDFCRRHGELIKGKVIVYKHMEHWDIHTHKVVATPREELERGVEENMPPVG